MAVEFEEQIVLIKELWKPQFCKYYENKLENAEEIAEYILEGQHIEDRDLSQLIFSLSLFPGSRIEHCKVILDYCMSRNVGSFLYKWNLEYVILAMNYVLSHEEYEMMSYCEFWSMDLPITQKVSHRINNSLMLEHTLQKFIERDEQNNSSLAKFLCFPTIIILRVHLVNYSLSEHEKTLMVQAQQKVTELEEQIVEEEPIKRSLNVLKYILELTSSPNIRKKTIRKEIKHVLIQLKEKWRMKNQTKCYNKQCSKSINGKVNFCLKCCYASYCSTKCANADWKVHKKQCHMLCKIGKNLIPIMNGEI